MSGIKTNRKLFYNRPIFIIYFLFTDTNQAVFKNWCFLFFNFCFPIHSARLGRGGTACGGEGCLLRLLFSALLALSKYFNYFESTRIPPTCYANSPTGGELWSATSAKILPHWGRGPRSGEGGQKTVPTLVRTVSFLGKETLSRQKLFIVQKGKEKAPPKNGYYFGRHAQHMHWHMYLHNVALLVY